MTIKNIRARRNGILLTFYNYSDVLLNKDVFNKSMLTVGSELTQEELETLIRLSAEIDIKTKALLLLARRSHSVLELKNKLLKRKFDKDIVAKILFQLKQSNYLNDRDFSFLFAEEKITKKRQSVNKVKADLFNKGINKAIIDEVVEKYRDDEVILKNIEYLAEKKMSFLKHKYSDNDIDIIKNKLFEYLFRKGYEIEKIKLIVK